MQVPLEGWVEGGERLEVVFLEDLVSRDREVTQGVYELGADEVGNRTDVGPLQDRATEAVDVQEGDSRVRMRDRDM